MAVTDSIDVTDTTESNEDAYDKIIAELRKHAMTVRYIRAWTKRKSYQRRQPILPGKNFSVDEGEDMESLCREATLGILASIERHSEGQPIKCDVELLSDPPSDDKRGRAIVIATIAVEISGEGPQPKPTRESEIVGMLAQFNKTIEGLSGAVIRIANARASEAESLANMINAVSTSVTDRSKADMKWQYKIEREREETQRERERLNQATVRSRAMWGAIETWAEEWSEVGEILSRYFTAGRKPGDPPKPNPKPPTLEELRKVFEAPDIVIEGRSLSEVFDPIRALIAEMLAEPDVQRRFVIAKDRLKRTMEAIPIGARNTMQMRMLQLLGAERAQEIMTWCLYPVEQPGQARAA